MDSLNLIGKCHDFEPNECRRACWKYLIEYRTRKWNRIYNWSHSWKLYFVSCESFLCWDRDAIYSNEVFSSINIFRIGTMARKSCLNSQYFHALIMSSCTTYNFHIHQIIRKQQFYGDLATATSKSNSNSIK